MRISQQSGLSRRQLLHAGVAGITLAGASGAIASFPQAVRAQGAATPGPMTEPEVLVGDVIEYQLDNGGQWEGHFGSVTFAMHPAWFDGGEAWFIRTDASDAAYAGDNGLVYVPLLKNALTVEASFSELYLFDGGDPEQHPVLSTVPAVDSFSPAFRVNEVAFAGEPVLLRSQAEVTDAAASGTLSITPTEIVVNYPLVLWPGGGLPVDPDLVNPLGPGNLVAAPDTSAGRVSFKLHQCYPGSRYIATDTSAVPMAGMMGVAGSAQTQLLIEAGATAPIYVFGNGLAGPAAMGFQPSIFNSKAGDAIWSPFWEHLTVVWNEGATPVVLQSEADVKEREAAAEVTIHPGTPDTDGVSFVVNCPAPILAANDFDPGAFASIA